MYEDNSYDDEKPRRLLRWPNILTRPSDFRKPQDTQSSTETMARDSTPSSTEMEKSENSKTGGTSDVESEFDNDALEALLRKHGLLPAVGDVPVVGGQEAVESDEGCTRPIDTFHAAQALKALRIVSKGESPRFQFVLPEEISPSEASEEDSVSDDNEEPSISSPQIPTILRIKKEESDVRKASISKHSISEEPKEAEDLPSTSLGCTSSTDQSNEATDEEKALINQILPLCGPFESVDYTDDMWYYKLKKIIFLRAHELEKENKNATARGDELRKRNEELRNLHGSVNLQSVTSAPQHSLEEVVTSSNIGDLDPQFQVFPDPDFENLDAPFQVFPQSTIEDLDTGFQVFSDSTSQYLNPENQDLPGTSSEDFGSQQPKWF